MNPCGKRKGPMSVCTTHGPYGLAIKGSQATYHTKALDKAHGIYHVVASCERWARQDDLSTGFQQEDIHVQHIERPWRAVGLLPFRCSQRAAHLPAQRALLPLLGPT